MEMSFCCLLFVVVVVFCYLVNATTDLRETRRSFPSRCSICFQGRMMKAHLLMTGSSVLYFKKRRRIKDSEENDNPHNGPVISLFLLIHLFIFDWVRSRTLNWKKWDGMATATAAQQPLLLDMCLFAIWGRREKKRGDNGFEGFWKMKRRAFFLLLLLLSWNEKKNRKNRIKTLQERKQISRLNTKLLLLLLIVCAEKRKWSDDEIATERTLK